MATTSGVTAQDTAGAASAQGGSGPRTTVGGTAAAAARRTADGFRSAGFPWYGLDEAFTGPRRLMQVGTAADGTVQHGAIGHGDEPSIRSEVAGAEKERFAVVVTVAASPLRRSGDGTGVLDATTASSAALLAGSGLLAHTWPPQLDHCLRDDWLDQQTETAFELAHDLAGPAWSTLSLPVDGVPTPFHYRESEFGWVLAGTTGNGVHIGAYGRGMSAYGLGFSVVRDVSAYA
ncbi:hypothetical protein [Streptomyces sp. ISL-10]|uniref:hypothetical protein n=1 Tax=Streptomyces sp. ISL-10 TaxID=2819172 RepID=UPI00203582A4|nr:hypothetical protein [Streptomyces sp. ISL-10]